MLFFSVTILVFMINNDILYFSKIEAVKLDIIYEAVNMSLVIQEIEQIFSHPASKKNCYFLVKLTKSCLRPFILMK
jgi:hypothetical protein